MSKSLPSVLEAEVDAEDAADAELFVEALLVALVVVLPVVEVLVLLEAESLLVPQAVSETTIASDKIPANNFFFICYSFFHTILIG